MANKCDTDTVEPLPHTSDVVSSSSDTFVPETRGSQYREYDTSHNIFRGQISCPSKIVTVSLFLSVKKFFLIQYLFRNARYQVSIYHVALDI